MLGVQRAQAADWVQGLGHVSFVRLFFFKSRLYSTVPYCLTCKSRASEHGGVSTDGELGRLMCYVLFMRPPVSAARPAMRVIIESEP